jgi:hypothetical protein
MWTVAPSQEHSGRMHADMAMQDWCVTKSESSLLGGLY